MEDYRIWFGPDPLLSLSVPADPNLGGNDVFDEIFLQMLSLSVAVLRKTQIPDGYDGQPRHLIVGNYRIIATNMSEEDLRQVLPLAIVPRDKDLDLTELF